jgi:hypothetical protein
VKVHNFIVKDSEGNTHSFKAHGNYIDDGYVLFYGLGQHESIMFYRPISVITELGDEPCLY